MAWEDKPTYSQLNTICRWLNYETKFPTRDLQRVDKYLQTHATRGQLRSEMTRLKYLKDNGIRTHVLTKISEGSDEIPNAIRQGHIAFVINTRDPSSSQEDGQQIRQIATENNVTLFTALDTVKVLLDVLEETTLTISTIDA